MKKLLNQIEENLIDLKRNIQDMSIEFANECEYDNGEDIIYDLPRVYSVSKHGYHEEYAVLKIDAGIIYLGGIAEEYGELKQITIDELNWDELLQIANTI